VVAVALAAVPVIALWVTAKLLAAMVDVTAAVVVAARQVQAAPAVVVVLVQTELLLLFIHRQLRLQQMVHF
jgi:hypothetical protein